MASRDAGEERLTIFLELLKRHAVPLSRNAPSVALSSSMHLVKQHKKAERICVDQTFAAGRKRLRRLLLRLGGGIHHNPPACVGWICRDPERQVVVRRIQENKECVIR